MPEKELGDQQNTGGPDILSEEDRADVLNQTLKEALETYRESLAADGDPETAKSKAVQKITELTTGEYNDLAWPITEKLMTTLELVTEPTSSEAEIAAKELATQPGVDPEIFNPKERQEIIHPGSSQLVEAVNTWWANPLGERDRDKLIESARELGIEVKFYDLKNIRESLSKFAELEFYRLGPEEMNGGFIGTQNGDGTISVIPADEHFFDTPMVRARLRYMFEGIEELPEQKPYFGKVERACVLRFVSAEEKKYEGDKYINVSKGLIRPYGYVEPVTSAEESPEIKLEPTAPAETQPPRPMRPEAELKTERETSQEEKDAIVQATLDVFRQELKNASVSAAEEAARGKFKETAGNLDKKTYEELRQKVTQEINALEAEERKKMETPTPPSESEQAAPPPTPEKATEPQPDDIASLRLEAQKLGIAFSDQATAEDIKRYLQERASFESKPPLPEPPPRVEDKPADEQKLEENKIEPEKSETETVRDQLKDSQEQVSEFLLKNPDVSEADQEQLTQILFQLKKLGSESAADPKSQSRWLERSWSAIENASRIMSKNEPGRTVINRETVRKFYQSPEGRVETPIPPPAEVGTETAELPPSELTAEELEAVFAVAKAEKIEDLPEAVKEKLGLGFNNLGLFAEKNKNQFFGWVLEKAAAKFDAKGTMGRFVGSLAENSRRDQQKAQEKFEAVKQGGTEHLSNLSYLGGNLLRYGRLVLHTTNYNMVNPLTYVMLGAMAFARGSEAAKEARFKNEEVIKKTRVGDEENVSQADLDRAEDEAWRIYEMAQGKAAGGEVSSAELNRAFRENLPHDISERLDRRSSPEKITSAADIAKNLTERWINFSLGRVQKKLDQAETEAEKQKILKKYEGRLNDFNRLVGDYGQIDALAMGAKISEAAAKGVRTAMTFETLAELPFSVHKIWSDIADALGDKTKAEEIAELEQRLSESRSKIQSLEDTSRSLGEKSDELFKVTYSKYFGVNLADGLNENEAGRITDGIFQLRSEGKEDMATAALEVFGSLKTSDTGKTVAEIIGARQEKLVDLYDRALGVDSQDGLSVDETAKIAGFVRDTAAAGQPEELGKVLDVYGGMEVKDAGEMLKDLIKESAPAGETIPAPEPIPTPEPEPEVKPELPPKPILETPTSSSEPEQAAPTPQESPVEPAPTPETKPGRFENIIDSSQVEGSDSVWKSTQELFMQNRHQMDYEASKDWPPSEWADKKTAELVKEYADAHGGQAPELVHDGDKVVVETGADGKLHLKVVSSSGEEVEPRALPRPESSPVSYEEKIEPEETPAKTEQPAPSISEGPEIKTDPAAEKLAREYQALPMDSRRDEFVYNHIAAEIEKPAYRDLKLPHMNEEKLIAFARMFGGGDWARISSPEKLAQTLVEFDNSMKFYTRKLVDGSLDEIFKEGREKALELTHNVFPVEAQNGEIFYAQKDKSGLWRIADSNGDPVELKRPIMGKTSLFDLKKVKNLLGYKSLENMPELPAEPNIETPTPPSEPEQAATAREAAEKETVAQKGAAPELAEKQNQEIPVDIAIGEGSFQGKVEVTPDGAVRFEGNSTRVDPSKILQKNWRGIMIDEIGGKRDLNFGARDIDRGARRVMVMQEVAKAIAAEKPAEAAALRNAAQKQIERLEKIYGDVFK